MSRQRFMKKTLLSVFLGAAALAFAANGHAANSGVDSGAMCSPVYSPEVVQGQGFMHFASGLRYGGSNSGLAVCPVHRSNALGTAYATVYAYVNKVSPASTTLSCSAYNYDTSGNLLPGSSGTSITAPGPAGLGLATLYPQPRSTFAVYCTLGTNDMILSVGVSEN